VTGSAVLIVAAASPAGAAVDKSYSHTFTDSNGVSQTCTIQTARELPFNGDPQVGRGATSISGTGACVGDAFITASWLDPNGNFNNPNSNTDGASVDRRYAPVGSQFKTQHSVDFDNCSANCTFFVERTK
jgi:hypothetical protein